MLLFVVLLAWDLYPYMQWSRGKGIIYKTVGKSWPAIEPELRRVGIRGVVHKRGTGRYLELFLLRQSLLARGVCEAAILYDRDNQWVDLRLALFPDALVDLDTSNTLTRVRDMN